MTGFKDGVPENTHPLNLLAEGEAVQVDRIPLYEVYMRMAEELAKRVGVSKATLVEHLRKAEGRLVGALLAGH